MEGYCTELEIQIDDLEEGVKKLEAENAALHDARNDSINKLILKNKKLREALVFYAKRENWQEVIGLCCYHDHQHFLPDDEDSIQEDGSQIWSGGKRARQALGEMDNDN